jgi:hypothetical protein
VKNIGNSPAIKVWKVDEIFIESPARLSEMAERDRFCKAATVTSGSFGHTLFPKDDPYQEITDISISKEDMRLAQAEIGKFNKIKFTEWQLPAYLVTCVTYSSTFNPRDRYYTGVIYMVEEKSSRTPIGHVAMHLDRNIPASQIVLAPALLAGTLAR